MPTPLVDWLRPQDDLSLAVALKSRPYHDRTVVLSLNIRRRDGDQVALRDRVSALEASDASQNAAIASLEDRVTALETNPLGLVLWTRRRTG